MHDNVTLLYVDDEKVNLRIFEMQFRKLYKVITALSGEEGLLKLDSNHDIIVVISDMSMPEMNGIEFIKKAREKFTNVFYYILTCYDINTEIRDALNENIIQKYFRKPFNIDEIKSAVEDAIAKFH